MKPRHFSHSGLAAHSSNLIGLCTFAMLSVAHAADVNTTGGTLATIFTGSYSLGDMIFVLLNDGADAITGTYSGLVQGATFTGGGFDWQISYLANSGGSPTFTGGNDIALMVVPEPRAALLSPLGMLVMLRRRRR